MTKTLYTIRFLATSLLLFAGILASVAQTFVCDGSFFISLYNSSPPTVTHNIRYNGTNAVFDNVCNTDILFNGTGFNSEDNYIYAGSRTNSDILRLKSDGSYDVVGSEPLLTFWNTGAGDCSPTGQYAIHDRTTNRIYFYDVVSSFSLLATMQMYWAPSSGNSGIANLAFDDFVFDPDDANVIYAYQRNYSFGSEPAASRGALLKINAEIGNPNFGEVEVVGIVPINIIRHMGAMFFDAFGRLYGYGSQVISPINQNRLIRIDKATADAIYITDGPGASNNDGCSCPFSVELEKSVETISIDCDTTVVVYELALSNLSKMDISGISFNDVLPVGGTIASITPAANPFGGIIVAGTGVGQTTLGIENIAVPESGTITFLLEMKIPSIPGTYINQASVNGLPSPLSDMVISDDPNTFSFEDATAFTINPEDVTNTSLLAIDSSFCDGDVFTFNGVNYSSSGIYVENFPGGAANGCDSVIQLTLDFTPPAAGFVSDNICTGSSYILNNNSYSTTGVYQELLVGAATNGCDSIVTLDLMVSDTLFGFLDIDLCAQETLSINGVDYSQTGNYEIFYENGAAAGCDSLVMLDLFIETVDVSLATSDIYCFDEAAGSIEVGLPVGGTPPYQYALNGGDYQAGNTFDNLTAGTYSINIIDANGCELLYEGLEIVDFSEPLILYSGQTDFDIALGDEITLQAYSNITPDSIVWSPNADLSCTDCMNPSVTPLFDNEYWLTVYDQNGCESAIVFRVGVTKELNIFVPNVFSPNGDGANDKVMIFADKGIRQILSFRIFSRWGEEVFHREEFPPNDPYYGWDGKLDDRPMQPAVFTYLLIAQCLDGGEAMLTGDILLMK